jgi:hypothetical protein
MKVQTMRAIDRYVGIPLCFATGLLTRFNRTRHNGTVSAWRSVLVIKFFGMGSLLIATHFLSRLHSLAPYARVTLLTFESNRELAGLSSATHWPPSGTFCSSPPMLFSTSSSSPSSRHSSPA